MTMAKAFTNISSAASGLCLGYAFCHIFVYQFVIHTVFETLGIGVANGLQSDLGSEEALGMLLLSLVLHKGSGVDAKLFQTFIYIGIGAWVAVGLIGS